MKREEAEDNGFDVCWCDIFFLEDSMFDCFALCSEPYKAFGIEDAVERVITDFKFR